MMNEGANGHFAGTSLQVVKPSQEIYKRKNYTGSDVTKACRKA